MNRLTLLELLEEYKKTIPVSEHGIVNDLYQHIQENDKCFDREEKSGTKHIATSAFLLNEDLSKALFMWHVKLKCWTQPGGHADGEENLYKVTFQELEEETGVKGAELVSELPLDIYKFEYQRRGLLDLTKNIPHDVRTKELVGKWKALIQS